MSLTAGKPSAHAVCAHIRSRKEEERAKQRAPQSTPKAEPDKLHEAFLQREVQPDALERVATVVRKAVDAGDKQVLVLRFPSGWLPDQGRAITNHDRNWPASLDGFARRAYDYFRRELEPRGFQIRAEIVDWPGGMPGDVGFYLTWKSPEDM